MKEMRCINCMQMVDEDTELCPHCGYKQTEEPSPFSMKPNTILRGRYLVGRVLGQGGFGITYVGYDMTLDVKVAIKEYFPMGLAVRNSTASNQIQWNTTQLDRDRWEQGCESFLKEARRMAKIDSLPGIVRVRDTFPENQTAYIVMDYVEGENLKQVLMKKGVMSLEQCITMLKPLMESLGKMHQKGLIHRDISPDNIMIQPDGSACLLDFGAAKDISFQQNAASQQVAKKGFSPPEQYREKGSIGSWTDVYALCATIYYCVTGKMVPDAMDRLCEDTLTFEEPLDKAAADILRDGLKLGSTERIQTVEELLGRLKEIIKPIPPSPKPFSKKKTIMAAAVCACLLVFVGINQGNKKENTETAETAVGSEEDTEQHTEQYVNTLMKDESGDWINDDLFQGTVLGSEISRDSIVSVTFTDTLDAMPDGAWDASWNQDGTVMAWTEQDANDSEYYHLFIGAEGDIEGRSCYRLFTGYYNVESIEFNDCFDTGSVIDMNCMFYGCKNLTELDVSHFNTENVTNMYCMFYDCENLTELNVDNFDTENVTDMGYMFGKCAKLVKLDVSNFDTSQVTDMRAMFEKCEKLTEVNTGGFDTGSVTDMGWMFYECEGLTALDVGNFDTGAVTQMKSMFNGCKNLTKLDVTGFETSQVTDMSYMFSDCENLSGLEAGNFRIGTETDVTDIFSGCSFTAKEAGLKLNPNVLMQDTAVEWDENNICRGTVLGSEISRDSIVSVTFLDTLDAMPDTAWDVSWDQDGTVMAWTEANGGGEERYDLFIGANGTIRAMDCNMLFLAYHNAEGINFNGCFDTSQVTNMERMFSECGSLQELDISGFHTENVTNMYCMFYGCKNLKELDASKFNTENVTDMSYMFYGCENLTELDVSHFNTENVNNMYCMFYDCENLTELNADNFDTGNVTDMGYMFGECTNLTKLDVSNFDMSQVTNMENMFINCGITAEEAGLKE